METKTHYPFTCQHCKKNQMAVPSLAMTMGWKNRLRRTCIFCHKMNVLEINKENTLMVPIITS